MEGPVYTDQSELEGVGGLYIETSEEGGWWFGDKTRFERVEDLDEVRRRLGLDLTVNYEADQVHVQVADPNSVSRMLVSKNDDVGTSIGYAEIKYRRKTGDLVATRGHIDDLVATRGQHITIEPFEDGGRIRLLVYPITHQ